MDRVLKGLASQIGQENDLLLVDGIRNNLFGPPGAGGLDLAALDIQRGRDHGLPDYNNLREAYDVPAVTTFAEISSDPEIQAKLEELFGTVDNIDPFVGALAEDHLPGSSVGPLIDAVVGNQFERLRDGDRFFYTNDALLNSEAVRQIINLDNLTLSKVIRRNTNITNLQDNVFFDDSVLIFEAPDAGANVKLLAENGMLKLMNVRNGREAGPGVAQRPDAGDPGRIRRRARFLQPVPDRRLRQAGERRGHLRRQLSRRCDQRLRQHAGRTRSLSATTRSRSTATTSATSASSGSASSSAAAPTRSRSTTTCWPRCSPC